jgi:hypothetical protein
MEVGMNRGDPQGHLFRWQNLDSNSVLADYELESKARNPPLLLNYRESQIPENPIGEIRIPGVRDPNPECRPLETDI